MTKQMNKNILDEIDVVDQGPATGAQWFRMLKNRTKREKMKSSLV